MIGFCDFFFFCEPGGGRFSTLGGWEAMPNVAPRRAGPPNSTFFCLPADLPGFVPPAALRFGGAPPTCLPLVAPAGADFAGFVADADGGDAGAREDFTPPAFEAAVVFPAPAEVFASLRSAADFFVVVFFVVLMFNAIGKGRQFYSTSSSSISKKSVALGGMTGGRPDSPYASA